MAFSMRKWQDYLLKLDEIKSYQKRIRRGHSRKKKRVIGLGGAKNTPPYSVKPSYRRSLSAPPGFGGALEEAIEDTDLATLEPKQSLNTKFWDDPDSLDREVTARLLEIAENFIDNMGFEIEISDIVLTGSLSNYNWSKYSDLDVHLITDFSEIDDDTEMLKSLFRALTTTWNMRHDISIKDHEVELYVQDENEPHTSTGVYSLMNDEWIVKPERTDSVVNVTEIKKKTESFIEKIDQVEDMREEGDLIEAYEHAKKLKAKIRDMRKAGLEQEAGEMSTKNLAFKLLRRIGELDRLSEIKNQTYDDIMSI